MSDIDVRVSDAIMRGYDSALGQVSANIDVNPDEAAEAASIAQDEGLPPGAGLVDFKAFKEANKRKLAGEIIRSNPALMEYVNANPLAPKISNDDYGQLDVVSEAVGKLGQGDVLGAVAGGWKRFQAVEKAIIQGAIEGYGWEQQKQEFNRLVNYIDDPLWRAFVTQSGFGGAALTFDTFMRTFNAMFVGVATGVGEASKQLTGSEAWGNRLTRDTYQLLQVSTTGIPLAGSAGVAMTPAMVSEAAAVAKNLRPWLEAGKAPPQGLHSVVDKALAEQSKTSVDNLLKATSEASRSTTRDRNPELFANFIRQHTDAQIGVSADAIRALYGDKPPSLDDGVFGWVPGIEQQLALAEAYGGDVVIPLSDWLARVDPAIAKDLRDDIRVRPGEPTALEVKLAVEESKPYENVPDNLMGFGKKVKSFEEQGYSKQQQVEVTFPDTGDTFTDTVKGLNEAHIQERARRNWPGATIRPMEPVEAVRQAHGLEPLFAFGDRKLTMQAVDKFTYDAADAGGARTVNTFDLYNDKGQNVGMVDITEQDGGRVLYIENIAADWQLGPSRNIFGPSVIRDLLRQIKETFPEAKELTGFRVSGAREAAGVKTGEVPGAPAGIKFALDDLDNPQAVKQFTDQWNELSGGVRAKFGESTPEQQALQTVAMEVLDRIAPKKLAVDFAQTMETKGGRQVKGLYEQFPDAYPVITLAMDSGDVAGYARHEAIHHLRSYGFFTPAEWRTLREAAIANRWLEEFNINEKYRDQSLSVKLEEAVAEGYRAWAAGKETPKELHPIFEKLKELLDFVREKVKAAFGDATPDWEKIFKQVEGGEVGSREGGKPLDKRAFNEALGEEPSPDAFAKAQAIGMTAKQYDRYQKLIAERQQADFDKALKRAEADQKRRLSQQWKDWSAEERPQAVADVNARPYVEADRYFREGVLFGNELERKPRLGVEYLTEDQQNILPKSWQGKTGFHPDDVAPIFGYASGADMLAQLEWFVNERNASKKRPEEYHRAMIDQEVNRRVEAKHGKLEENILEEAMDQALSKTQVQLLHEEAMALAAQAGQQFAIDPVAFERAIKDSFAEQRVEAVNADRILAAAGKAGKAAEMALLEGKPADAFREKQRQYIAVVMAREARQLEKDKASVDKLAKRFSGREVKGVEREFTDFVQVLLSQAGYRVRMTPEELASQIQFSGYANLTDFVAAKAADGWEPAVSETIQGAGVKPLEQMTVAEFREFKDAVDSLAYIGREVNKIEIAGQKQDMVEFRNSVRENLSQLPVRGKEHNNWLYRFDASLTRPEEIMKDLDLRQEAGPMWEAVFVPLVKSKSKEFDLLTALSKHFEETHGAFDKAWYKSLKDTVQQDFLYDAYLSEPGNLVKVDLNRENLINIMLNWGNKSNRQKVARGFAMVENEGRAPTKAEAAIMEQKIDALIHQHARKEDWDFVQRMVQPFKDWKPMMEQVSRNTSGVAPKWVDTSEPVVTPHGEFEGWYWPVKYDRYGSNMEVIKERQPNTQGAFGNAYFRAATAQNYLKERTGYTDIVDINTSIEQAAATMQQTIHDIAFRDSIMQAGKVLYDKELRRAITKHYGREYTEQFDPWLKRIAHQYTAMEKDGLSAIRDFMKRARVNLVGHALPLNLKVIGSPDIGTPNPAAWARFEANRSANKALAMEKSNEIRHLVYNMDRDFREQLERITTKGGFDAYRAKAVQWGFGPMVKVSQEFRMATFVDQYNRARAAGHADQQAIEIADSYVRERHGAASAVDLPAIMNSNEAMKALTMFYGYFNTMYNWQRQIPGNVRRGEIKQAMVNAAGSIGVGAFFGATLFNQYKESDSWWKIIGKALLLQPLATVPGIREASSMWIEGYPQRTPMESTMSAMRSLYTDIMRKRDGKPMKNPIKNTANVLGMLTGFPLAQPGRTGEFVYDLATGQQPRPRNIGEWFRGIVHGEARLKP